MSSIPMIGGVPSGPALAIPLGVARAVTASASTSGRSSLTSPNIYNLKASNTVRLRTGIAAAAAGVRNCLIGIWTPSTGAGQSTGGGTSQAVNAWPMQLASRLQAAGINAGANGFFGDKGNWGGVQSITSVLAGDYRLSITDGTTVGGTQAFGGNAFLFPAVPARLSFTPQNPVTRFEVAWRDNASVRSFNATIDAGPAALVTTTGVAALRRTLLPAVPIGMHTINFDWVAGNVTIVGCHSYNDANGRKEISFLNGGIAGAMSARFNDETDAAVGLTATLAAYQFDAAFYDDAPINDWRNGVSVAASKANATAWVQKVKAANVDPVLITPLWDNGTLGLSAQQDSYAAMLFEVAIEQDVPLIDIRGAWGSYALASAKGWYSDSIHPAFTGSGAKAAMMQGALMQIQQIG
ncbi:hypothetical protein C8J43_102898 [Sphingomonas sp. PP-CE-1G-424]|nr:hypothetical protein C8J43_102898 [Sphingomonas sp. PP-CE-1G-424]